MEHEQYTWGAIIVMMLPKQTYLTSCQEDSEVSARIASEDRGGGTAKPLYPEACGIMRVPVYACVCPLTTGVRVGVVKASCACSLM